MKPVLPTVPMSPAFALKHRVRLPAVEVPEEKVRTMVPLSTTFARKGPAG